LFLVVTLFVVSSSQLIARALPSIDTLRVSCLPIKHYTSDEIYAALSKQPVAYKNGETSKYSFDRKDYLYSFNIKIQSDSDNMYIVNIVSTELDNRGKQVPMTARPKEYHVNPIVKKNSDFQAFDPKTHANITHDRYNDINTMKLTNLNCWLVDANEWGLR
jgi:hypothetical protein